MKSFPTPPEQSVVGLISRDIGLLALGLHHNSRSPSPTRSASQWSLLHISGVISGAKGMSCFTLITMPYFIF